MKKFILLVLLPVCSFAQQKDNAPNSYLKFNLLSVIDVLSFPTLQLSYERNISNNFSISAELGYQIYNARHSDTPFILPKGYKANVELRYYGWLNKLFARSGGSELKNVYAGVNFFTRNNQYNYQLSYTQSADTTRMKDCIWVDKQIFGFNLVLGYQSMLTKRIVLDAYASLGIMQVNIKNYERNFSKSTDKLQGVDLGPLFQSMNLSEYTGLSPNINFGMRLGIKL